ncbi:unnamed protein product, partial [Musa acuminata subsp. malaccensis]
PSLSRFGISAISFLKSPLLPRSDLFAPFCHWSLPSPSAFDPGVRVCVIDQNSFCSSLRSWSPGLMASISVPCPKCSVTARYGAWSRNWIRKSTPPDSFLKPAPEPSSLSGSAWVLSSKVPSRRHFPILKAHFQEVAVVSSSNSSSLVSTKSESTPIKGEDSSMVEESANEDAVTDTTISAFMAEVSNLVKLVDSKDITELHLKTEACDLLIRKKEALPQPPVASAPVIMQYPQTMLPPQPSAHVFPSAQSNPVAASPAPALPPPPTTGSKSSLPPLKSPMAGTFYRCPAPGEPPFVKAGDKVQKGQVVCIIEAMKLMNEIEADQSGTVVEILAEDGKPVSVDTVPLLLI